MTPKVSRCSLLIFFLLVLFLFIRGRLLFRFVEHLIGSWYFCSRFSALVFHGGVCLSYLSQRLLGGFSSGLDLPLRAARARAAAWTFTAAFWSSSVIPNSSNTSSSTDFLFSSLAIYCTILSSFSFPLQ